MRLLVLGLINSPVTEIIKDYTGEYIELTEPLTVEFIKNNAIDFAISYRYRHIISEEIIQYLEGKIINLHISLLPWNRGADPNLWSFLEDTKKGVSIHFIDRGIDTGDLIIQKEIDFNEERETLSSSYSLLEKEILKLFKSIVPNIFSLTLPRKKQAGKGTYHRLADKRKFEHLLQEGWDTPVIELKGKAL